LGLGDGNRGRNCVSERKRPFERFRSRNKRQLTTTSGRGKINRKSKQRCGVGLGGVQGGDDWDPALGFLSRNLLARREGKASFHG